MKSAIERRLFWLFIWVVLISSFTTSMLHAAITWSGDLDPLNPNTWTSSTTGYIGKSSTGTVTVDNGSTLLNYQSYVGYNSGSNGTVTVTGTGSIWNLSSLYVPYSGKGTLTVTDGGLVTPKALYASLNSLFGNGTISTNGAVLDVDWIFDATHGAQNTFEFGSGGILNINPNGFGFLEVLGAGYKDKGTLQIADGIVIISSKGDLGYLSGSTGTATVTGKGSLWYSSDLYIGYSGNGTLNIQAGGQVVSNYYTPIGYVKGSVGLATVTGIGSQWTTHSLDVGDQGKGILNIEAGGQVSSYSGRVGANSGSNGTVTITGTGSQWIITDRLIIGSDGSGTMQINSGGQVSSGSGLIGNGSSSISTVTVTGTGSKWINNGDLFVGSKGSGKLTVDDGGAVIVNNGIYASLNSLLGNGTISAHGAVLDANLVFDAAHGQQNTLLFGTGGTLNVVPNVGNVLGAGYKGNGTLTITDGMVISSSSGFLGYQAGSLGMATVNGNGSQWTINGNLAIGSYGGKGNLNIEAGGRATASAIYIGGNPNSVSWVTVTGLGSQLKSSSNFVIGSSGILRIEAGGQVYDEIGYLYNLPHTTSTATVIGTGSNWVNNGNLYVGNSSFGFGKLNIMDGATVTASGVFINYKSYMSIDVERGSKLSVDNGNGTITNDGTVRIVAGASVLGNKTYSPISAATWNGGGGVLAFGGKWNATDHSFTVSGVQSADSGILLTINLLSAQRVLINDNASHWILGASFPTNYSSSLKFIASPINDGTLDALRRNIEAGDVLLGGWNLKVDRNLAGMPVYLSFGDGVGGYSDKNMHVWSYDGTKWSQFDADNLNFDGAYANFITTATGCFAVTVTVPEPGVGVLLGAGILGAVGFYMRKRWRR